MDIATVDLETFWDVGHSLTKMSPIQYCMHKDTDIISCAFKFNDGPTEVVFGEAEVIEYASNIDWSKYYVVGHNLSGFDAMILSWRMGVKPKLWGCTLAMARPIHAKDVGLSLGKLVEHYELGVKDNTALVQTKGKRLADFTRNEVKAMRKYNAEDVDQCYGLFKRLIKQTPKDELRLIDLTIRMLVEPQFDANINLLAQTHEEESERKEEVLRELGKVLYNDVPARASARIILGKDLGDPDEVRRMLMSAVQFKALLEALGVDVPTKISPTTGKEIPALAKSDEAFLELQKHENPLVAHAAAARLDAKSTLLQTRINAFLDAAQAHPKRKVPIPLKYYGADTTGRWSGWGYNPQNLPRVNPKDPKPTDALRKSLRAPKGHKVVVADLSGIELRVNHFLWKVPSSMALYQADPEKADLYKDFAANQLYMIPEADVTKSQRQIGKVCVAEGTLLMCKHMGRVEWIPIEAFTPDRQLWDGEKWVWAKGVVSNGWKQTQKLCGVSLTPDHLVLCGTQWREARYVTGENLARALETGAGNLSLRGMLPVFKAASLRSSSSAIVGFLSTQLRRPTSKISKRLAAILAPRKQPGKSDTGSTTPQWRTTRTAHDYSTDCRPPFLDVTTSGTPATQTMAHAVSMCVTSGAATGLRFSNTSKPYPDGTNPLSKWIAKMWTVATAPATSGLFRSKRTQKTNGGSENSNGGSLSWKHVYDIVDSGPDNRFTVLTDRGPMVVHNCHLGLGFGAGAATFQTVAKLMAGVELSPEESVELVGKYRAAYREIVRGWKKCHSVLPAIARGADGGPVDPWGLVHAVPGGLKTPKGMIRYPNLRQEPNAEGRQEWVYGDGRHKARIYGPKIDENIVQHLARNVIADNMLAVQRVTGYRPALTVHDELVYVAPDNEAEDLLDEVQNIMRTPPTWWPELITWSEGDIADTYGDAK